MGERIVIASDHAAVELKAMLVAHLQAAGHAVDIDLRRVEKLDTFGAWLLERLKGAAEASS